MHKLITANIRAKMTDIQPTSTYFFLLCHSFVLFLNRSLRYSMRRRVYVTVGRPSVRLSKPRRVCCCVPGGQAMLIDCCTAGGRRSAAAAPQQMRAVPRCQLHVGSWTQTCLFCIIIVPNYNVHTSSAFSSFFVSFFASSFTFFSCKYF